MKVGMVRITKYEIITVRCIYCGELISEDRLLRHQRDNKECKSKQLIAKLCNENYVPCDVQAPIAIWSTTFIRDTTITAEQAVWVPLWLGELWIRASKSPITGRLDCLYEEFLKSVKEVRASERRQGILTTQAKLREIGYFSSNGSIWKAGGTDPIWQVSSDKTNSGHLRGTQQDFSGASSGMMQQSQPFVMNNRR